MGEYKLSLDDIHPASLLGVNNQNLKLIQNAFPKLRIVARGNEITIIGDDDQAERLKGKLEQLMKLARRRALSDETVADVLGAGNIISHEPIGDGDEDSDFLLMGNDGQPIKAKSPNQKKLVEAFRANDLTFAIGPAGTGKTYTSVALAVRALKRKECKRIIIARPAVEAGENLGFLPGDLKDKIDPYLRPVYDALDDMIGPEKLKAYFENRTIEVAPLAFMRGRTLNNSVVILDEAQNATHSQLKMFLTRMGPSAKFIVTGDLTQIDLPRPGASGLLNAIHILKNIPGIAIVELSVQDVIRHRLVRSIVNAYEQFKNIDTP